MAAEDPDIDEPYTAPQGRTLGGTAQEPASQAAESPSTAVQPEPEPRESSTVCYAMLASSLSSWTALSGPALTDEEKAARADA